MDYYATIDGKSGPYSLEELANLNINGDTLIWHNGLDNWVKASTVKEVAEIIVEAPKIPPPPVPNNHMTLVILSMVLSITVFAPLLPLCITLSIIALVKAISVKRLWENGQYSKAKARSSSAKTFSIINLILSIISITVSCAIFLLQLQL